MMDSVLTEAYLNYEVSLYTHYAGYFIRTTNFGIKSDIIIAILAL